ncbi:MAG TPA: sialidase family protein [Candidatus Thermoplasmatota archaeon]|nr:sialidase family protein [Candidatus Thermoplasmatota archaeon]
MRPVAALAPALLLVLAGCVSPTASLDAAEAAGAGTALPRVLAHDGATGALLPTPRDAPEVLARTLDHPGAEPTLGVTSTGTMFVVAYEKVLRSRDAGATWEVVSTPLSSPTTLDPYLYVDPDTDRVYSDQLYLGCSWLSWSDDEGASWTTNPVACGLPVNDHQKLASGKPRGLLPQVGYPKTLYYAYNAINPASPARVSISYDGGLTWPVNRETVGAAADACAGGLHGNLVADAEGNLYLPKRHCDGFILSRSTDGGMTWTTQPVGADAGGSPCLKNADLAVDRTGGAYGAWPGKDNRMYLSTSADKGETWRARSLAASPPGLGTTTMPALVAGDAGRIALVYYGTEATGKGPDEVPDDAVWHVYVTTSQDALAASPTFVTVRATDDPVQVGPISTNSACDAPQGSRNLLDFIDAQLDAEGRLVFAYADGCLEACAASPSMAKSRSDHVAVGLLQRGPSLFADAGLLSPR